MEQKNETPNTGSNTKTLYSNDNAVVLAGDEGVEAMFRYLDPEYKVFKDITGYINLTKDNPNNTNLSLSGGLTYSKQIGNSVVNLDYNTKDGYRGSVVYGNGDLQVGAGYDELNKTPSINANYRLPLNSSLSFNSYGNNNSTYVDNNLKLGDVGFNTKLGVRNNGYGSKPFASIIFDQNGENGIYGSINKQSGSPLNATVGYKYSKKF
jgi:hypothetical protein